MKRTFSAGIFFLLIYAFGTMFMMFFGHVITMNLVKDQKSETQTLLELAIKSDDKEKVFQYNKSLRGIENSLSLESKQELNMSDAIIAGVFGGVVFSVMTYFVYRYTEKISKQVHPRIWSPRILFAPSTAIALFYIVYAIFASWKHPHLLSSPIDMAVALYFSFPIPIMISLHLVLQERLKIFEKKYTEIQKDHHHDESMKDYRTSIDLEHKTWTQLLQSSVFGLLFIISGVLIALLINAQDMKEMSSMNGGFSLILFEILLIALFFFTGFFGVLMRVLRYLGDLSELLTKKPVESTQEEDKKK